MVIPIKCGVREYFKRFTECLNPILKLKPREIEVMATLLMVYHSSPHLPEDKLYILMYDKDTRKKMRRSINMSEASFNNHISQLKKKKVLDQDGKIHKFLTSQKPENNTMEITYKLDVQRISQG